jgi:hypothetical protein
MKMKKKMVFTLAAILLVAVTTLTFAHTSTAASVNITAAHNGDPSLVQSVGSVGDVVPNTVQLKYSTGSSAPFTQVSPTWNPLQNYAGNITAGDVYYVDATPYAGDIRVTIYLTNSGQLYQDYTYLNLKVNVWTGSGSSWTQGTLVADATDATDYITLDKGMASFILQGNAKYCISIDDGDYYCIHTTVDGSHSLSPDFYLDVKSY